VVVVVEGEFRANGILERADIHVEAREKNAVVLRKILSIRRMYEMPSERFARVFFIPKICNSKEV
jgi:hypothetical protein